MHFIFTNALYVHLNFFDSQNSNFFFFIIPKSDLAIYYLLLLGIIICACDKISTCAVETVFSNTADCEKKKDRIPIPITHTISNPDPDRQRSKKRL